MRVLWLSHFVPFPATGLGALQRSHNLLRQAAARHDLVLVALNRTRLLPGADDLQAAREGLGPMLRGLSILPHEGDASRVRRLRSALSAIMGDRSYLESWMQSAAFTAQVVHQIREFAPDVIHVDAVGLIGMVPEAAWSRVVLNHHNVESQLMGRRAEHLGTGALGWFYAREADRLARLERRVVPRVGLNIVVSELDRERLDKVAPGGAIRVVENGVDVDFFRVQPGAQPQRCALVFAGGMDWYPNRHAVDWLCEEIWPALTADGSDWSLTVAGRSPSPRLLSLAETDARVSAPGFVDDVRPTLGAARIYVCPITDGGGTRLKILDALSLERALVSTRLGVEGLGLQEERHYLNAETPGDFVRQCRRLRRDDELAERIGREGRAHVLEHFSWDKIGARLDRAYSEASQGGGRRPCAAAAST